MLRSTKYMHGWGDVGSKVAVKKACRPPGRQSEDCDSARLILGIPVARGINQTSLCLGEVV